MRPLLCVFILFGALAAHGRSSPAELVGARFAAAQAVQDAKAGDSGALAGVPSVFFPSPGTVELFDGESRRRCAFTASGNGLLWSLTLDCGGTTFERDWTWLPSGAAWTNLVGVPDGELLRWDAEPGPVAAAPAPPPTELTFAAIAGKWVDGQGVPFVVEADGTLILGEHRVTPMLALCLHVQVQPPAPVPCLRFAGPQGKDEAFALLGNFAWVEGVVRAAKGRGPPTYEGWQHGRLYGRERPARKN
jgi:hypothetical protein